MGFHRASLVASDEPVAGVPETIGRCSAVGAETLSTTMVRVAAVSGVDRPAKSKAFNAIECEPSASWVVFSGTLKVVEAGHGCVRTALPLL